MEKPTKTKTTATITRLPGKSSVVALDVTKHPGFAAMVKQARFVCLRVRRASGSTWTIRFQKTNNPSPGDKQAPAGFTGSGPA